MGANHRPFLLLVIEQNIQNQSLDFICLWTLNFNNSLYLGKMTIILPLYAYSLLLFQVHLNSDSHK